MKTISQQVIFGGEVFNIAASDTDRYHAQPFRWVSGPGKQSVPQQYDQFRDLESVRVMEERYGIKEEGLF